MASENSPANSARLRLRGGVCALYRARAADSEKKYLLRQRARLALQSGQMTRRQIRGGPASQAIVSNPHVLIRSVPNDGAHRARAEVDPYNCVRRRTDCKLAQQFNARHGRTRRRSSREHGPGEGQLAAVRAAADCGTKCGRDDRIRPVVRKVRAVIRCSLRHGTKIGPSARSCLTITSRC